MVLTEKARKAQEIALLRSAFISEPNRHVVLDEVIEPSILTSLRQVVSEHGQFSANLKLRSSSAHLRTDDARQHPWVSTENFALADNADKFISQSRLVGAKPGHEESVAIRAERLMRAVMHSNDFLAWLSAISGASLTRAGGINLKLHGAGHFLRKHSDKRRGRKLCLVHYLHEHWEPSFGGRFILHRENGDFHAIDPVPNRMIIFDVTQENFHEVEPLGQIPEGWFRINYSAWFA